MATDLIQNGDFEAGEQGWQFTSGGSTIVGEEQVIIGNKYCKVASTESIFQGVPLLAGVSFTVRFRFRGVPGGTVAIMKLNTNDIYWEKAIGPTSATEWNDASHTFQAEGAWAGPYMIHFQANTSPGNFLELDNIELVDEAARRK